MVVLKRILYLLLIGFMAGWIYVNLHNIRFAFQLFHQLTLLSLTELFILQTIYTLCLAASNQGIYHALGVSTSLFDQTLLILTSGVANRLIPTGGISGIGSFVYLANQCGIRQNETIQMTAVSILLGYLQIVPIAVYLLMASTFTQKSFSHLPSALVGQVSLLVLATSLLVSVLVLLVSRPSIQAFTLRLADRFPRWLKTRTGLTYLHEYASWCMKHWKHLLLPLFFLLSLFPIRLLMLFVCFSAFHLHLNFFQMTLGYTFALISSSLSFLPTTLGVFETLLIAAFHNYGLSIGAATAVTLLYRSYTFWIPIPFGLLAFPLVRNKERSIK